MTTNDSIQPNDTILTHILHKVVSYWPEKRITIERYSSGVIQAFETVLASGEVESKTEIPLTDDLRAIEWDFGYVIVSGENEAPRYEWSDFRTRSSRRLDALISG